MAVTVNTPKITQIAKQFYPERCGKAYTGRAEEILLPAARVPRRGTCSGFAGRGQGDFDGLGVVMRRGNNEKDGRKDHCGSDAGTKRDGFADE
jgi:hypothetical protein